MYFVLSAPKTFNLDIALVKLAEPVKLNDMVNVACIPDMKDYFPPGTVCVTAGWGHTVEGTFKIFILKILLDRGSFCGNYWYPLFQTSCGSAYQFQSQGRLIMACALLMLVCNDPQSHLCLLGLGLKPRSLNCEVSIIP